MENVDTTAYYKLAAAFVTEGDSKSEAEHSGTSKDTYERGASVGSYDHDNLRETNPVQQDIVEEGLRQFMADPGAFRGATLLTRPTVNP